MIVFALLFGALAAYLGYWVGVRRERGAHERVAEMEAEAAFDHRRRGGIRLRRISVRR